MTDRPAQRPEGKLIAEATKRSSLSVRDAVARVPMSEGRWYQIVRGYQTHGQGIYSPVRAPADTLARMAQLMNVTPKQLESAGREDAAEELRKLPPLAEAHREPTLRELADEIAALREVVEEVAVLRAEVKALKAERRPETASDPEDHGLDVG